MADAGFLRRLLEGQPDAMARVPPVRLAIRRGRMVVWRDEQTWPLAETEWTRLFLDADGRLKWSARGPGKVTYPAWFQTAPVERELEVTGPLALHLWLSAPTADADVFVRLQHVDADRGRHFRDRASGRTGAHGDGLAARLASGPRPGTL